MARHKDIDWRLPEGVRNVDGSASHQWVSIQVALLMDIRDELKGINSVLHCHNFLRIPQKLDAIQRNTKRKTRKK